MGFSLKSSSSSRKRNQVMSEINVTPFVDVMLVLLIVFMVSAPLLTVGVPVNLPETNADSLPDDNEPLTVTRIYVRGDKNLNYGRVIDIMGNLSGNGFTKVALITETKR